MTLSDELQAVIRELHEEGAHPNHYLGVHPDTWVQLAGTDARPAGDEDSLIGVQSTSIPAGEWELVDTETGEVRQTGPVFA